MKHAVALLAALMLLAGCTTTLSRSELAAEYYNLGTAFFDLGELERSADYLSRALELDETLARASYNLARVYTLQQRYDQAEALLQELLTEDPDNTTVLATLAYVAYSAGEQERAVELYDRVLAIDPGNVGALYNRALIAMERDNNEYAASLLRQADELTEADAEVFERLAEVEQRLGNTKAAIAALEELVATGNTDTDLLLELASLYESIERYDRALDTLDALLDDAPTAEAAAPAESRRASILLTAAEEAEQGIEALQFALEAGFSDVERLEELREAANLVAAEEVDDLLREYGIDLTAGEARQLPPTEDESREPVSEAEDRDKESGTNPDPE